MTFDGLGVNMSNLSRLSNARTRSISAENIGGARGGGGRATEGCGANAARDLGQGWKISPCVRIGPGETYDLAAIDGPGAIQHLWFAIDGIHRHLILRIWWDDQEHPSVECPIGDFFASPWQKYAPIQSLAICVNPRFGFNGYWEMPFRKNCRMTLENRHDKEATVYYQIDYTQTDVPEDCAYFHAQFRRVNPLPYKQDYTILDGVQGRGQFVGVSMGWGVNNNGWWGEGEIKFFMDGDQDFPTICGTGTEDYFGGAWCFAEGEQYLEFSTPYSGMPQVIRPDGFYQANTRFSLYRWHIVDPVRFEENLRVTIQALGWREGGRYLPLQDDLSSVAFWYQTLPTAPFPELPDRDAMEVV